jgi:hypothetical protein
MTTFSPPWIFENGVRRHSYLDVRVHGSRHRIKEIRTYDLEGSESLRWKIALRLDRVLKEFRKAHQDLKDVEKAQCIVDGRMQEYRYDNATGCVEEKDKRPEKNPVNAGKALRYRRAFGRLCIWRNSLSLAEHVLTLGIMQALPSWARHPEKGHIVVLTINGRDYTYLSIKNRHGVPCLEPLHYPTPEEPKAVSRYVIDFKGILDEAMTRTLDSPQRDEPRVTREPAD